MLSDSNLTYKVIPYTYAKSFNMKITFYRYNLLNHNFFFPVKVQEPKLKRQLSLKTQFKPVEQPRKSPGFCESFSLSILKRETIRLFLLHSLEQQYFPTKYQKFTYWIFFILQIPNSFFFSVMSGRYSLTQLNCFCFMLSDSGIRANKLIVEKTTVVQTTSCL